MTDVHAPEFLRVNGPLANIPEFYAAFGIKPGTRCTAPTRARRDLVGASRRSRRAHGARPLRWPRPGPTVPDTLKP